MWQKAMDLVDEIYVLSSRFPKEEQFGLVVQLRKSAISIPSNLAEGAGRRRVREFRRFSDIAYGSLMEVETQLEISRRRGYIADVKALHLLDSVAAIARMLNGLRTRLGNTQYL